MRHDEPEHAKTLGPYRVEFRFASGQMFVFAMDDAGHARVMDEFFSTMLLGSRPPMTQVTVTDAIGHVWYARGDGSS
jgi:hypothetical protein